MSTMINLPNHPRVLVITLRRLGDVLLTTPLIRSIRRGFPKGTVDVLVFRGCQGMLSGNPDVDRVITTPERSSILETLSLASQLFRKYDLVLSTQAGDRPTLFAFLAGRYRVGLVPRLGQTGAWKRHAHHITITPEPDIHRVTQLMAIVDALGLDRHAELVSPQGADTLPVPARWPYAVVHASPLYRYKRWTDAGWRAIAQGLAERGLTIIATEGPDPVEQSYLDSLWGAVDAPITRVRLDWSELGLLLKGAAVYIGPDTSTTHLAAAAGCPTIALYGPTSPQLIGPWPVGGLAQPWDPAGKVQNRGNVWVVQNPLPCLPCEKLGCAGHLNSFSHCMDELPAAQVLAVVDRVLGETAATRRVGAN
jgi:heptosyltransferase-3